MPSISKQTSAPLGAEILCFKSVVRMRDRQNIIANETFVNKHDKSQYNTRRGHQNSALTKTKLLGYFAELALKQKAILPKQFERIAILL